MLAENPCIIGIIYIDFSKAFDKVDFGILFHKMKDMSIVDCPFHTESPHY